MNAISVISSKLDTTFTNTSADELTSSSPTSSLDQLTHVSANTDHSTTLARKPSNPTPITVTPPRRRNPFTVVLSFILSVFVALVNALKNAFTRRHPEDIKETDHEEPPSGITTQTNLYPLQSGVTTGLVTRNPRRSSRVHARKISQSLEPSIEEPSRTHQRGKSSTSIPQNPSLSSLLRTKTLVLDLDETLIHSTSRGGRAHAHMVEVMMDKHAILYYVYKRPHVDYFLRKVSEWYKVVIFTASMQEYADPVIDWLDQGRGMVSKRLFRQSCTQKNGSYCKDLVHVEPDLSKVCLVDNSPMSYSINKENGIPIQGWTSDPNDEALLDLLPFLDSLRFTTDVRSILSFRTLAG